MAFISNKERSKISKKIYRGYGFAKFSIFVSSFCGVLCSIFILLGILAQLNIIKTTSIQFVLNKGDTFSLTTYGIIAVAITSATLVFGIVAIFAAFYIQSPNKTTKKVHTLTSSAVAGKKNSSSASKTIKERLA